MSGYESVSIRELHQLLIGNCLLFCPLEALIEIAIVQAFSILEHPAEPDDLPDAASIWRLPLTQLILTVPGARRIRFSQGLVGAATSKPTDLLTINLDDVMLHLHRHRVKTELPNGQTVGKDSTGHWKTALLKESPPAVCHVFSACFLQSINSCRIDPDV